VSSRVDAGRTHLSALRDALDDLEAQAPVIESWARRLADALTSGGRLLVAGNGGSAAQAQHLAAELVGRYRRERRPFSAVALTTDSSALTAIGNDYGFEEVFARQVRAHGRRGDVLLLLTTSGSSPNVLRAAAEGRAIGMTVWALTGALPPALVVECSEVVVIPSSSPATIQESHLVALHLLCDAFDRAIITGDAIDLRAMNR